MAGRQVQLIGGENYPYFFTSRVIAPNPEGLYPFYISAILVENETIRHELYRCRRTIMCLNAKRCPWQVRFLRTWMVEYFLPSIRTIEESREQYLANRYRDLRVNVPSAPPQYISQLAQVMDDLEFCLKSFTLLFTDQDGHVLDEQIETKMVELQRHFDLLESLLLVRYDEMELFWPVVIKEHGPKEWQEVLEVMMTGNYAIKGEAMATFTAATLNSMGLPMENNLREALMSHILSSAITSPAHAQYIERGDPGDIERGAGRENSEVLPFDVTLFSTNTATTAVIAEDNTEYSNRNALNTGSNRSDAPNPASPTEATIVPTVTATTIIAAEPISQRFAVDERSRFQFGTRPWCSLATQEEYLNHYPFAFSEFLLRTWDERYLRFQLLLFSICLDRDLNEALDIWKDKESWCLCRIS